MSVTTGPKASIYVPEFYPNRGKPRMIGQTEGFIISAIAPACAVVFTNPFDTAKVRLQLQGQSKGAKKYSNSFDAMKKIYINEGIKGLQKGLTPAILREGSKNIFRIGMFDPIMNVIHDNKTGRAPGWKRALAGSLCGVMGALACNPFELVKTRLQSASAGNLAIGHQHNYAGVMSALQSIYSQEGFKGLYRGSVLSMSRSIVGSGANLSSFSLLKEYLILEKKCADSAWVDMVCGLTSGAVSCLFMNPIDVIRTRFYNQPYINGKGELYTSGFDAIHKIYLNEGLQAFYKGLTTHFLRIGPHFCCMMKRKTIDVYHYLDLKESFNHFDADKDGVLNAKEVQLALKDIFHKDISTPIVQEVSKKILNSSGPVVTFDKYSLMEKEVTSAYKKLL